MENEIKKEGVAEQHLDQELPKATPKPEPVKVTVTAPVSGNAEVHLPHPDPTHPDLHVTVESPATPQVGAVTRKSVAERVFDSVLLIVVVVALFGLVHSFLK